MKTILYVLAFIVALNFSCENKNQTSGKSTDQKEVVFPYKLDSVPSSWVFHQTDWFEFFLPPGWQPIKRPTIDSYRLDIITPDTTFVLASDDYGFGRQKAVLSNTGWPNHVIDVDTLTGEGNLYYNLEEHIASLILYESFWITTGDSLTTAQFETACKVFQTVRLRPRVFSSEYFKSYQGGQLFREPDPFRDKIDEVTSRFSSWGFTLAEERTLDERRDFQEHWWLSIFKRNGPDKTTLHYPKPGDWEMIQSIRQFKFRKSWQFVIEEWQLESDQAARRWLDIAVNTRRLDDYKPPREYWIDGDKMYFVMATAAQDWSMHGDELVQFFSGRSRFFLHLFNQPLDLKAYKKGNGANSGARTAKPFYFKPDTIGTYYEYFWFHQLRHPYPSQSFEGLKIKSYIYGPEIGTYEEVEEALIGVKAKLKDHRLKHLNLVGKDRIYLTDNLGDNYLQLDDLMIYQHNGDLLICHLSADSIDWFHFIRTNLTLESGSDLPAELRYYEERLP